MVYPAKPIYRQAVCIAAIVVALGSDPRGADSLAVERLQAWIAAVKTHTPGETDEPLRSIAVWSQKDIDGIWRYLQAVIDFSVLKKRPSVPTNGMEGDLKRVRELAKSLGPDFPKRAALLHTDIVMLAGWDPARVAGAPPSPFRQSRGDPTSTMRVLGPDGRFEGYQQANPHWNISRRALGAIPADEDVRRWYHTVASYFAKAYAYADLNEQLDAALRAAPDDPHLLFDGGCHQEGLASAAVQDFVRRTPLPAGQHYLGVTSPPGHWHSAETYFRRALSVQPGYLEVRVRLGRVLSLQGKHAEAITEFDRVDQESSSPSLKYLANLFRGDAERSLDHADRARTNYQAAVALYDRSQAARIALGHLLREAGDRDGALRAIEPALAAPAPRAADDDPFWDYLRCDGPYLDQLYGEMIAPFLKEKAQ